MLRTSYILCFLSVMLGTASHVYSQCNEVKDQHGKIDYTPPYNQINWAIRNQCWKIHVPESKSIELNNFTWNLHSQDCNNAYLKIHEIDTNKDTTFCGTDSSSNVNPITALSDVQIDFYFRETQKQRRNPSFSLRYDIKDAECLREDSFHCTTHLCISKSKVCDGEEDCENGLDEIGCAASIKIMKDVKNSRVQAISWLKSKGDSYWGWHENTPRAVTALYLSNGANFNGTILEEELMAQQSDVNIAIGLLKNPVMNELLSTYIDSLLVTCHNPRHFYGQNLVKRLKTQMESSAISVHPIAYLALCNSNATWPSRAFKDLSGVLGSDSEYQFAKDIQSYAVMAIMCYSNNSHISNKSILASTNLLSLAKEKVENFKKSQLSDGSFGNVLTTSLVTQAIISSGQEHVKDWKLNATINYLIKELNSTDKDFSSVYLTLPIFNGKSFADIFKVNCTGNPRSLDEGYLKSEIDDYVGPKMRIQYSLFIGDDKDIMHTISLRVPENYTAYQVMRYAEEVDNKYKFEWKLISNKMYVYKIGEIVNDPTVGKFWLLYLESSTDYKQTTSSPDQIILSEGDDHLIMWYKKSSI